MSLIQLENIFKQLWSLEEGVEGTLFNPSDSDMSPGRICYLDMLHTKGEDVANAWQRLKDAMYA